MLCLAGLAIGQSGPSGPAPSEALQQLTVQVHGVPSDLTITAERGGTERIELTDNGAALLVGELVGPPARSVQLRLLQRGPAGETEIWQGIAMLGDHRQQTLAFSYELQDQWPRVERVPASPPLHSATGDEPAGAYHIALGWGGLVLGYLGILVVGWAIRGRRQDQA